MYTFIVLLLNISSLLLGFANNEQSLSTVGTITTFDGDTVTLDDMHMNGNLKITLFVKPRTIEIPRNKSALNINTEAPGVHDTEKHNYYAIDDTGASPALKAQSHNIDEILLTNNPRSNEIGPLSLSTIKKIVINDPRTKYVYQENAQSPKYFYLEMVVDGTPYLAQRNWKISGTDTATGKKRSLDLTIVHELSITCTHPKEAPSHPIQPCTSCVCPAQ
jgi:hypothetical protein